MTDLKPCFCGGNPIREGNAFFARVRCDKCYEQTKEIEFKTWNSFEHYKYVFETVGNVWNNRVAPKQE